MNNGIRLLVTIALNTFIGFMYYLWQIKGVEQAGNVYLFWVWFVGIVGTLAIFIPTTANDYKSRTALHQHMLRFIVSPLIILATVWAGHIFAATVYTIAVIAAEIRHREAKKLSEVKP